MNSSIDISPIKAALHSYHEVLDALRIEHSAEWEVICTELGLIEQLIKNKMNENKQPTLRAVPMSLYPTMGSLTEAIDWGISQLPITNPNQLHSVLMTYHNTVLKYVQDSQKDI